MGAEFSIEGSVSGFSPFSDVGKDLEAGELVTLKLENPGTVSQVRFDVEFKSASYVPDITLSPVSGVPPTPAGEVTFTAPVGFTASYKIRCITGDGTAENAVKSRIVAIRSASGTRHVVVTERDEYNRPFGWAEDVNKNIDLTAAAVGGDITGPGASTDGAIATWNDIFGNQLRNNALAIIPPGTGRLQLSERIELGSSPSAENGLNLTNGQGVFFRTIGAPGQMQALSLDASDDLLIGDAANLGDIVVRASGGQTFDVKVGGVLKLRAAATLLQASPALTVLSPGDIGASTGYIRLPRNGNLVARKDGDDGDLSLVSITTDILTLGDNTDGTIVKTGAAAEIELRTGITAALKATATSVSIGETPAPSGTLAMPRTSTIRASNQDDDDYVPMIGTSALDLLVVGGNDGDSKGVYLETRTGYTVAAGVAGVTELLVEAGKVGVVHDLEVQGGLIWPSLEPKTLLYTTRRSTTNTDLEDVTGASTTITLLADCRVIAEMTCETSASTTSCLGGWAIEIDGVDGEPIRRYLSGSNDTGSIGVMAWRDLPAGGPYTIQARHQRVSGAGTVNTDKVQLVVRPYIMPA